MRRRVPIIALLAALSGPAPARAEYPDQPIKAVVPFAAGGYVDGFARIFTDRLGALLGKAVIVENKPGAGGKIGDDYVASARPDGLTLLIDDVTRPALTTLTNPDVAPNEMLEAFALAGMLGYSPIILTAAPALGVKDFASLIAWSRPHRASTATARPAPARRRTW
jgi:tripartite-type tricarboxylate transporter receptor subunit TctC